MTIWKRGNLEMRQWDKLCAFIHDSRLTIHHSLFTQMEPSQLTKFLQTSPLLTLEAVNSIAAEFIQKDWKKGDILLKAGRVANEYVFLESGFIRSYVFDTEGNEITLDFFTTNDLVFEVTSFFQRIPSQEFLEALTDCTGWVLTYEKLNNLFHSLPAFR